MMLYPAMNKLTANVPNRYLLVNVVARRVRQIAQEAEDMGEKLEIKPVHPGGGRRQVLRGCRRCRHQRRGGLRARRQ